MSSKANLTESFFASILRPATVPSHLPNKDAGIYLHELHPHPALRSTLKKSSTSPNCLAASSTHVFAAQADKAVVHVYNLERNAQECIVPLPEKVTALALVGGRAKASNGVLAMGLEGGRIVLWELGTGRQVFTPAAHLQAVTCVAADPTSNFLVTGSADGTAHVWAIPTILTFSPHEPYAGDASDAATSSAALLHTLASHRGPLTSLAIGHGASRDASIAVTASEDKSVLVWAYRTGVLLQTFLLADIPLSIAFDPADRGCYVGFMGGSVQMVDFYDKATVEHPLHGGRGSAVIEPRKADRWIAEGQESAVQTLAVSYDGTRVLTGHENGHVHVWDVGTGTIVAEKVAALLGPVTNLLILPIVGLSKSEREATALAAVVKPQHASMLMANEGSVPGKYVLHACFKQPLATVGFRDVDDDRGVDPLMDDFIAGVFGVALPQDMLDEDIASLQEPATHASGRSFLASNDTNETEDLHALLAHTTQESLELKNRVEQLGSELVRLRQADRDRQRLKRIKQERRAQADALRRKVLGEEDPRAHGPPADSSAESNDSSIGY